MAAAARMINLAFLKIWWCWKESHQLSGQFLDSRVGHYRNRFSTRSLKHPFSHTYSTRNIKWDTPSPSFYGCKINLIPLILLDFFSLIYSCVSRVLSLSKNVSNGIFLKKSFNKKWDTSKNRIKSAMLYRARWFLNKSVFSDIPLHEFLKWFCILTKIAFFGLNKQIHFPRGYFLF